MTEENLLKELEKAVLAQDVSLLEDAFNRASASGLSREAVLTAMAKGLDAARLRLGDHTLSIPEFLLSVDVLKQGLDKLSMLSPAKMNSAKTGSIVIGVVEGDIHELGKNIVAGVLEASGYTVIDLGRDVSPDLFIEKLKETRASLLALSTMMSTPLENMKNTVTWCKRELPGVAVIVGGATVDEAIAQDFGADGYAESVVTVCEEVHRILER
jgi:methanogenic corrinoid protein MtbC1